MGKIQFCRICRTEKNLKFTVRQLRAFNKTQLSLAQGTQGSETNKASKKLLRTTPTLGNICNDCNDRIQIFHRLDECNESSGSDIEVDVVNTTNAPKLPPANILLTLQNNDRPDTPVIVDDNDMLYKLFMQKIDTQRHQQNHLAQTRIQLPKNETLPQAEPQHFGSNFIPLNTPPQSNVGSEGDDTKVIEVLTSRESTPVSIERHVTPLPIVPALCPAVIIDEKGHRILDIIDLDDEDESPNSGVESDGATKINLPPTCVVPVESSSNLLDFIVASAKFHTDLLSDGQIVVTSAKNVVNPLVVTPSKNDVHPIAVTPFKTDVNPALNCPQNIVVNPADDDDEKIIFRSVDPHLMSSPSKKRKRKSYENKEMRLIESVSLISSESETEDNTVAKPLQKESKTLSSPKHFECKQCKLNFPDSESLSVHDKIHQGIKCPVCQFGYSQEQRLIHHMRYKHRTDSGHHLAEKPRVSQDSAMTIRLRFMQRKTFYECQLCGRIDEIYKEHKNHILTKHPIESQKLNDPIMKELKCPVCKCKCGTQYITLCRHIIGSHIYCQFKSHLRELHHLNGFGWNASKQKEVFRTARIYQFLKKGTFFFQCKTCKKVVAGYLNHLKHNTKHANEKPLAKTNVISSKSPILKKTLKSKKSQSTVSNNFSNATSQKTKQINDKEDIFKKPNTINIKQKQRNTPLTRKSQKPIESIAPTIVKTNKGKRKCREDQMTQPQLQNIKVKAIPTKIFKLRRFKCKYCPKKLETFRLYNLHLLKEHKHNEFQHCIKCEKTYRADRILSQNQCSQCKDIPGYCDKQRRKYVKQLQADVIGNCKPMTNVGSKDCTKENSNSSTAACKPKVPESKRNGSINKEFLPVLDVTKTPMWLKDLLNWKEYRNNRCIITSSNDISCNDNRNEKDNSLTKTALCVTTQSQVSASQGVVLCCYCMHLFRSHLEMQQHVQQQHTTDEVLMKYQAPSLI